MYFIDKQFSRSREIPTSLYVNQTNYNQKDRLIYISIFVYGRICKNF